MVSLLLIVLPDVILARLLRRDAAPSACTDSSRMRIDAGTISRPCNSVRFNDDGGDEGSPLSRRIRARFGGVAEAKLAGA
jgi:hypothetical protein